MNDDTTPLYMEPLVGWRLWAYEDTNPLLNSGFPPVWWPARKALEAVHQDRNYPARSSCRTSPCDQEGNSMGTGCGIYAYKKPGDLVQHIVARPYVSKWAAFAIGRISLWGRIVEHTRGYRAQFAYPRSLVATCSDHHPSKQSALEALGRIAAVYGIPVEEDQEAWTSELQSVASSQNHFTFQSPWMYPTYPQPPVWVSPIQPPRSPSQNLSWFQPSGNVTSFGSMTTMQQTYIELVKAGLLPSPNLQWTEEPDGD